jgi:hypothetical protein
MAITIQSSGSISRPDSTGSASTAFSFPVTVASGTATRLAVAYVGNRYTVVDQSIPTYDGTAMTAVAAANSTDTLTIAARWWIMDSPTVGTANIAVTNPGNTDNGAWFWLVVDGALSGSAGSIGGWIGSSGTSTPTTATVGASDLAIVAAVSLGGLPASEAVGTTAIGVPKVSADGAAARGWAGYRAGANPSLTFATGQIAWATLVIPGASSAFAFTGTVPAQTGATGTAITTIALAGYFSGGTTPYTYAVQSGALPGGLSLNTSTGDITGTPSASGSFTVVVRGTDAAAATADTNSIGFTISVGGAATALTMTGPSTGVVGSPSTNFTVGANGTISSSHVVTPSDGGGGGTFTPTSVTISSGTPTQTFTYTPASSGAKTISATDAGGYTAPSSLTYTVSAALATLTSSPFANNTDTLHLNIAAEAFVHNPTTGALVVKKTGLTSHATTGVISFSDAALVASTSYRVIWRLTVSGAEGFEVLTAV